MGDWGDRSLLGTGSAGAGSAVDRPDCAADNLQFASDDQRSRLQYFNTALFSREDIGEFGTCFNRFFHGPEKTFRYGNGVTNATFGNVTSARSARVGQVALKFLF